MKRFLKAICLPLLMFSLLLFSSCKKEETPKESLADAKKEWVTGTWKQKDITLGVSTKVEGIRLKAGWSMLDHPTINALLMALAGGFNPFELTRNNKYSFNGDGTYQIEGNTMFSLPDAGQSGNWKSEVYGTVIALFPDASTRDPHWINSISASKMNLAISVELGRLGAVPLNLVLEKQ